MLGSRSIGRTVSNVLTVSGYLWNNLPGRHWPMSAREEQEFLEELRRAVSSTKRLHREVCRDDVSLLMSVLRNGVSFAELREYVPGASPALLVAVYEMLEGLRRRSAEGFEVLLNAKSLNEVMLSAPEASLLMPLPSRHLAEAARMGDAAYRAEVEQVRAAVEKRSSEAQSIERALLLLADRADPGWAVQQGRKLYDPYVGGIWSEPFFLPPRVGTLVPERVADLWEFRVAGQRRQ